MNNPNTSALQSKFEAYVEELHAPTVSYTLAHILEAAILGCAAGKSQPELRHDIAEEIWHLLLEYSGTGEDEDLYQMRYGRLVGEIESQSSYIMKNFNDTPCPDTEWTKLTWLIEDQQKILP